MFSSLFLPRRAEEHLDANALMLEILTNVKRLSSSRKGVKRRWRMLNYFH